jgi:LacI family transcriptional regulator
MRPRNASKQSNAVPPQRIPKVVLLIESSRSSGRNLLAGIADYTRHHGPWAYYWEPGGLAEARPHLRSLDADGIILRDVDVIQEVLALGLPAIVVGHRHREIPGLANVVTDTERIGHMAAEHLLERGLRHFAYSGFKNTPWSELRGEMFARKIETAGFSVATYAAPAHPDRHSWKKELQRMAEWLRSLPRPLGLMACNDDNGQHVIEACKIAGLRVPDEISVLGTDNDELVCELSDPPLSSIALNFRRAGYESAQLLDQLMRGRRSSGGTILVPATGVVTRQSTEIWAVEDVAVSKALRFINDHASELLHVDRVARAAGVSRRVLEKRFRARLNRSVLHQIRRARVDRICHLLGETNQSISQIALSLGYSGVEHIARYFRAEKKMTPLNYRRLYGRK